MVTIHPHVVVREMDPVANAQGASSPLARLISKRSNAFGPILDGRREGTTEPFAELTVLEMGSELGPAFRWQVSWDPLGTPAPWWTWFQELAPKVPGICTATISPRAVIWPRVDTVASTTTRLPLISITRPRISSSASIGVGAR